MSLSLLIAAVVRGVEILGLAAVIGGLAVGWLIPPAGADALSAARVRLRRWIRGFLALLLLLAAADLPIRAQAMSGVSLTTAVAALPDVLARTHFGAIWSVRAALLAAALVLSIGRGPVVRTLCALAALGIALTTSLTGHAAEWGDVTFSVSVDWVHAVAASAWTGGLLVLALVVFRREAAWPPALLSAVARRFSRLAGACLLLVIATGAYNAWAQLGAVAALWTTPYGRLLILKLLVGAGLVWFGAVNRYLIVPRLDPGRRARGLAARLVRLSRLAILGRSLPPRAAGPSRFSAYLLREASLALVVFACTAALGEATPGRHAQLPRRLTTHVSALERRQSLDVGKLASLTLPPGDAARGRALFVDLQCAECHAAPDQGLPPPRRPGPDLANVTRAQPAYLVESIVNPNAMIVDGEHYTRADGTSTMPDYREKLTVSELIDLVAYLRSLDRGPAPAK